VIVVAGGHLSVGSKLGNVNIGSGPVEEAKAQGAVETADAAVAKAAEIAGEAPEEPPWR
jgi:hypothetical protein